jgi:hypothetical protein
MWDDAIRYGQWFAQIPFVCMVAMTGALAVRNPVDDNDDYDYLLVTKAGRVWLARAFAIILVRLVRLAGRELCPNYVLAVDQLAQERRDLFMAREVVQMHPIFGGEVYRQMWDANDWTQDFLANATPCGIQKDKPHYLKRFLEWILGGWLGDKLEQWEFERKRQKFQTQVDNPHSSAVIDAGHVKGHFNDNGYPVMQQYQARLRDYGLVVDELEMAGD